MTASQQGHTIPAHHEKRSALPRAPQTHPGHHGPAASRGAPASSWPRVHSCPASVAAASAAPLAPSPYVGTLPTCPWGLHALHTDFGGPWAPPEARTHSHAWSLLLVGVCWARWGRLCHETRPGQSQPAHADARMTIQRTVSSEKSQAHRISSFM